MVKGYPANWSGAVARNIASSAEGGLGRWSDEEIKRAITQGSPRMGARCSRRLSCAGRMLR